MRSVQCLLGSVGASGRVHIPVSVSIPEAEWRALAERLGWGSAAADHPALAALMGSALPRVVELSELPLLREELDRVPPGLLEGPAASAAARLREYLDQAATCVEAWRAGGERTKLSAAFQRLDRGHAVKSDPPDDGPSGADAEPR